MAVTLLKKLSMTARLVDFYSHHKAHWYLSHFSDFFGKKQNILDLGCGTGNYTKIFLEQGHRSTPVDVVDLSFSPNVQPIIYDGKTLPFKDQSFDLCYICTVLHHATNPEQIIKEAARVAKQIIIVEDVYDNPLQLVTAKYFYFPLTVVKEAAYLLRV